MPSCSSCPPLAETVTVGQALETVTHFLDLIQHLHLLFFSNAQLQQLSPTGWNSHSRASIGNGHTLLDLIQHLHLLFFSNAQLQQLSPTGWNSHSRASIGNGHTLLDLIQHLTWKNEKNNLHTELGRSQVEVQRCTLSWEVGEELGEELARRKLRWKLMQTWSRRRGGGGGGGWRGGGGQQLW